MSEKKDRMFRYLEKYVGKYRVLAPYDTGTEDFPRDESGSIDESFDDMYIPCSKGEIRGTAFNDDRELLAWYTTSGQQGRNVFKEVKEKYPKIALIEDDCGSYDYYFYFEAKDINKIATVVKPRTNGAKIKPFSDKNLPKPVYSIPEEDDIKFNEIVKDLQAIDKMQFVRSCCSEFDEIIQAKKGKRYDIAAERKKSKLKPKMFIHSIGLWNDFIKFTKEKYKEKYA